MPHPLVIFLHGGAFAKSDKRHHIAGVLNCLQYGYAVASVNYRLNDEVHYPDMRTDCLEAIRFLAARPDIDGQKIILWGETHGGYSECVWGCISKEERGVFMSKTDIVFLGVSLWGAAAV